ncbi:MAG: cytochrome c peroxidase, partial [Rudaea sp.]
MRYARSILYLAALTLSHGACGSDVAVANASYAAAYQRTAALREVGRQIFSDPAFSASARQSCASCHSPALRYNPPNALDVQPGGRNLHDRGLRAPPTLTYLNRVPPYDNHFHEPEEEADASIDNGPTGGLTWDGRV